MLFLNIVVFSTILFSLSFSFKNLAFETVLPPWNLQYW